MIDTTRTLIYSGRPLRVLATPYVRDFNENRAQEIKELCDQGIVPGMHDMKKLQKEGSFDLVAWRPQLMGQGAGAVNDILSAKAIIHEMVDGAVEVTKRSAAMFVPTSRM